MTDDSYERVLCVKNEVFVYRIPARQSNRGYRGADWKLDSPDWTGRLKVVSIGKKLFIKLQDKNTGQEFAQCPVDGYPGKAVEQVLDSSRYFVLKIVNSDGRSAYIGIGFTDRGDSFDLIVAIQDHFKVIKREEDATQAIKELQDSGPKLDLGFKEGQTIKINLGNSSKPRPNKSQNTSGTTFLPPPPSSGGGISKLAPPPSSSIVGQQNSNPSGAGALSTDQNQLTSSTATSGQLLGDFSHSSSSQTTEINTKLEGLNIAQSNQSQKSSSDTTDLWGDFTGVSSSSSGGSSNNKQPWVQF